MVEILVLTLLLFLAIIINFEILKTFLIYSKFASKIILIRKISYNLFNIQVLKK